MSGNAIEWCNDWYNASYYKSSPAENPTGPDKPGNERQRVLRGGAWALVKDFCKTTFRTGFIEDQSGGNIGFRIAKTEKN